MKQEEMQPRFRPFDEMWCPHMHIAISKMSGQGVEMLPSQGFNAVLTYRGATDTEPYVNLVSRCQGPACPHYIAPLFSATKRGKCGLDARNVMSAWKTAIALGAIPITVILAVLYLTLVVK